MNTPFSIILTRFEVLSGLENKEQEYSLDLAVGPSGNFDYGAPDTIELMEEPEPCSAALGAFLDALPVEVVYAFTTLMLSGQDQKADAIEYWKALRSNFPNKERAMKAVLEKFSRVECIKQGIELLPPSTTLNDVPMKIASL